MTYLTWGQLLPGSATDLPPDSPFLALLAACEAHPDFDVVELRSAPDGQEWRAVVVDVGDGTVASRNDAGIHPRERLMLLHRPEAAMPFEVRALRRDFPKTLHQNGVSRDEPRSLCLYDQPWSHLERTWTPAKFLTRVLQWLEKTADGSLHAADQALEPIFFHSALHVLLPVGFEAAIQDAPQMLRLRLVDRGSSRVTLAATFDNPQSGLDSVPMQPLSFTIPAVAHPPIQELPRTLGELEDCLTQVGSSLFPALLDSLRGAAAIGLPLSTTDSQVKSLLLPRVPRTRGGRTERVDVLGFVVEADLARLGLALGILHQAEPGGPAFPVHVLGEAITNTMASTPFNEAWKEIELSQIHIRHRVNRAAARHWSGVGEPKEGFRGVLAGCGALGSALALFWAREAWGSWTVVDPDVIEPHNPVRHQALDGDAGRSKAEVVAFLMRFALGEADPQTRSIRGEANDSTNEEVRQALASADLLVDASTTLEVPRDWSQEELPRSASMFLTPSGSAAVLLLEDEARTLRLMALEAQYYRAILRNDWGASHLDSLASISVGAGCRDRSAILSSSQIGLHAALMNQGLQRAVERPAAQIRVWMTEEGGGVQCLDIPTSAARSSETPRWAVHWDDVLEERLQALREAVLPLETGGILVGVTDHKARTIYLVDAYPAPSDSVATEHEFIRGREGVAECRFDCMKRTRGMVDYVGDWHSHPRLTSATPSHLDLQLVSSLAEHLAADGVPAVMVIAGHNGDLTVTLCE